MTSLRFQSGAHMNERTCIAWMLLAASSRESYSASCGEHRHALAHDAIDDRPAQRRLLRRRSVAVAQHARGQRLIRGVAQQQERALGRHDVEHQIDDARQDLRQRLHGDQRLADLAEQAQQARLAPIASLPPIGPGQRTVGDTAILRRAFSRGQHGRWRFGGGGDVRSLGSSGVPGSSSRTSVPESSRS